jgi:N-acetylmuramoyl-L-alanine amidase
MNIINHRLVMEAGEGTSIPVGPGTFILNQPQMPEQQIVIHAPGWRKVAGAVGTMHDRPKPGFNKRSVHLVIGEDGKQFAQMLPFNKVANHIFNNNSKSIGVDLVYRGSRGEPEDSPKVTKSEFLQEPHILASSLNNSAFSRWSLFPREQLDTLFKICQTIDIGTEIVDVVACEEIQPVAHPGPAFPIVQFRERLLGVTQRSIVLQKMAEDSQLLGRPGEETSLLSPSIVKAGTAVSIINEKGKWYLVSVIGEVDGNPWLIGWVKKSAVTVDTRFTPVVRDDHLLETTTGRRFQRVEPHPNGYDTNPAHRKNPKFILMHFTTGTRVESTISHFTSASSGVTTHLLIGRDGRVVQFLPFDVPSNHAGFSWWEGERNLNRFSVGIELDNAGTLSFRDGVWIRKKVVIPKENVVKKTHWKEFRAKGWETFPPAQLEAALKIVKALKKKYKDSLVEILGHDMVNIRTRWDPGPAFPLEDFRMALFNRAQPVIKAFKLNVDAPMYTNVDGIIPNLERTEPDGTLPADSTVVASKREHGNLIFVQVINSTDRTFRKRSGWVESFGLAPPEPLFGAKKKKAEGEKVKQKTRIGLPFYPKGKNPPSPKIKSGIFKKGTRVRIEEARGEWTLVVLLKKVKGATSVEGWIKSSFLTEVT